jgi:hypothetical protein
MKIALAILVVGVIILAVGVGIWVDAAAPKSVNETRQAYLTGESTNLSGFGAGLTVFGLAMTAGGVAMVVLRRKSSSKSN